MKDLRARLKALALEARARELPIFVVGGCVRDWLRGAPTDDIDLSVEGEVLPLHPSDRPVRVGVGRVQRTEESGIGVGVHESPRASEITDVAVVLRRLPP